jgi:hypothetical protein
VAEDWRLTVSLEAAAEADRLRAALHDHEVEKDALARLGGRVAVSGGGEQVLLYADSAAAAHEAEAVVKDVLASNGLHGGFKIDRWHHEEEEWEDASAPLPTTTAAETEEHARLEQEETEESQKWGFAEWEVRIEFASHHDARAFEERIADKGYGHFVRRWSYVLIGTNDHDDAERVAADLRDELPAGASLTVERGSGLAWELYPRRSAFVLFGGLGG